MERFVNFKKFLCVVSRSSKDGTNLQTVSGDEQNTQICTLLKPFAVYTHNYFSAEETTTISTALPALMELNLHSFR